MARRISPVIPGFSLTLGYSLAYLSLLVLIPLAAMFYLGRSFGALLASRAPWRR